MGWDTTTTALNSHSRQQAREISPEQRPGGRFEETKENWSCILDVVSLDRISFVMRHYWSCSEVLPDVSKNKSTKVFLKQPTTHSNEACEFSKDSNFTMPFALRFLSSSPRWTILEQWFSTHGSWPCEGGHLSDILHIQYLHYES